MSVFQNLDSIWLGLCIIFFSSLLAFYICALYHSTYWRRRGIPGPPSKPFFGNLLEWWKDLGYLGKLRDWTSSYGKVYGIQEGWKNILVVSDLDMLYEVYQKKFEYFHSRKLQPISNNVDTDKRANMFIARGARWKRLRAIANPVFSVNNLKKIMPTIEDSVRVFLKFVDKAAENSEEIDLKVYFQELTMDVICRIAMGQRGTRQFQNDNSSAAKEAFLRIGRSKITKLSFIVPWMGTPIRYLTQGLARLKQDPIFLWFRKIDKEVRDRKEIRQFVAKTRNETDAVDEGKQAIDFIDLFLDAESDEVVNVSQESVYHKYAAKIDKKLTTDEVTAQCVLFLLAGFETTATALTNTCFNLISNLDCQKRLQEEFMEICPDGNPTYEQLNQMKYLDAVIKETLRMHPGTASFACTRTCMETTTVGKYTVEAGTIIQPDSFSVHYDPEIWGEDSLEFNPDRWFEKKDSHPLAWFPFGAGPRMCIGFRLAYLEEKLALYHLLRRYTLLHCPQPENIVRSNFFGVARDKVIVKLESRVDSSN